MYIERAAHPVFYGVCHFSYPLSDQPYNSINLMRFSLYFLTDYRVQKTLTYTCALPANTLIFESDL